MEQKIKDSFDTRFLPISERLELALAELAVAKCEIELLKTKLQIAALNGGVFPQEVSNA
jgi:hypothetical protein